MTAVPPDVQRHWTAIRDFLSIRGEDDYDRAVESLNSLLDEVGADESHPLYSLLDTLGTLIRAYEEEHYPFPDARGGDVLRFLMDEHGLTQSDLPEIGSQGVISEILRGKRELNIRQVRLLAQRFHVSPAVFV
jgi:HTH-type transcriptional regulator/antitoxin HigA